MNIQELYDQYNKDFERAGKEWAAFAHTGKPYKYDDYKGFQLDYGAYTAQIAQAIKEQFGFSDKQTGYVMAEVYDRFHSGFSDMFWGAVEVATFVKNFPKD